MSYSSNARVEFKINTPETEEEKEQFVGAEALRYRIYENLQNRAGAKLAAHWKEGDTFTVLVKFNPTAEQFLASNPAALFESIFTPQTLAELNEDGLYDLRIIPANHASRESVVA